MLDTVWIPKDIGFILIGLMHFIYGSIVTFQESGVLRSKIPILML